MVVRPTPFQAMDEEDAEGTIWAELARARAEPPGGAIKTYIQDIVSNGNITLDAGESIDIDMEGNWRVMSFLVDFAADVDATVYIDGQQRFTTGDRKGLGGQFRLGDGVTTYMEINQVRIVATNQSGADRDVRAWMVCS